MSALSLGTVSGPITLLKMDVECLCTAESTLMGASSGSAFFALFAIMDRLGLIISCVPVRTGEMEVLLELGLGGFNLAVATEDLTSHGVDPSLPVRLTFLGVQKTRVPLCAASVTLTSGIIVWREPKIY